VRHDSYYRHQDPPVQGGLGLGSIHQPSRCRHAAPDFGQGYVHVHAKAPSQSAGSSKLFAWPNQRTHSASRQTRPTVQSWTLPPFFARPCSISYVFICKFYKQWVMMSVCKLYSVLIGLVHIQPRQCPINSMHIHLYCEPNTSSTFWKSPNPQPLDTHEDM
jgi:hypothetical protein